jgi:LPXTG-motif cell wall-anchored protein
VSTTTSIAKLADVDPGESLPRTGAPSIPLITLGSVLMAAGLAITVVSLRRQRGAHS